MKFSIFSFCILLLLCSKNIFAQQLVYTPINPNFGGSPFISAIEYKMFVCILAGLLP